MLRQAIALTSGLRLASWAVPATMGQAPGWRRTGTQAKSDALTGTWYPRRSCELRRPRAWTALAVQIERLEAMQAELSGQGGESS
jgi:hypothetical protein